MKRFVTSLSLLVVLTMAATAMASDPKITGHISGTELCPQFICGAAAFTGDFQGKVGGKGTKGTFYVQVNHGALPTTVGGTTPITGGSWIINTTRGTFLGTLTGLLTYEGNDLFDVHATLVVTTGGTGNITLDGTLSHQGLPFVIPTIWGDLSQ